MPLYTYGFNKMSLVRMQMIKCHSICCLRIYSLITTSRQLPLHQLFYFLFSSFFFHELTEMPLAVPKQIRSICGLSVVLYQRQCIKIEQQHTSIKHHFHEYQQTKSSQSIQTHNPVHTQILRQIVQQTIQPIIQCIHKLFNQAT